MESFSITYLHDGTVCMSGDMGCLMWQREYFPKRPDYGFPYKDTGIGYFAEKICRAEECQKIEDWKRDRAIAEIEESIKEYSEERGNEQNIKALEEVLEEMGCEDNEYGHFEMLNAFNGKNHSLEGEDYCNYGMDYSDTFRRKFEMLKSVSGLILEAINVKTPEG